DLIDVETVEEALEICHNDPLHKAVHVTQEIHPYFSDLGPRLEGMKKKLATMG
ncbi:MAG: hypothetical protein HN420_11375, partial [Rhodospirillaceae bacterium]|nr:hypothetical protein [Rhodospirillaceae bacterium]